MNAPQPVMPWWMHVAACIVCFAAGALVMFDDQRPKKEPPAPAIVQKDGSRILERNPVQPVPALPMIPKGSKVIRVTTATIEPKTEVQSPGTPLKAEETIQLTEIQAKDGTTREIASTKDGTVIGGSDWTQPVGPPAHVYHWEVQAIRSFNTVSGPLWGASVAYTKGPLVGSVSVIPGTGGAINLGLGVRW